MTPDFANKARQKKTFMSSFCFAGLVFSLSFATPEQLSYIYMDEHTAGSGNISAEERWTDPSLRGGNLIDPVTEWPQQHFHLLVHFFVQMLSLSLPSCVLSLI